MLLLIDKSTKFLSIKVGVVIMEYKKISADMTLRQGIEEFRSHVPNLISKENYSSLESQALFEGHDAVHVVSGLGTSIVEESLVDAFTYCATDLKIREALKYSSLPEIKSIFKNGNKIEFITGPLKALPRSFKIWKSSRSMPKKWSFYGWEKYIDVSLKDIRKEFGIHPEIYQ